MNFTGEPSQQWLVDMNPHRRLTSSKGSPIVLFSYECISSGGCHFQLGLNTNHCSVCLRSGKWHSSWFLKLLCGVPLRTVWMRVSRVPFCGCHSRALTRSKNQESGDKGRARSPCALLVFTFQWFEAQGWSKRLHPMD